MYGVLDRRAGELEGRADALVERSQLPIDVKGIAEEVGLRVREVAFRLGPGATLVRDVNGQTIELVRAAKGTPLDHRERFSVAHEIGHWICDALDVPRPRRRREYWIMEQVCDKLAARLLIPIKHLAGLPTPHSAVELASLITSLASEARVSFVCATKRLADRDDFAFAAGVVMRARPDKPWSVAWSSGSLTELVRPARQYIRDNSNPLAPIVTAAQDLQVGERREVAHGEATSILVHHRTPSTYTYAALVCAGRNVAAAVDEPSVDSDPSSESAVSTKAVSSWSEGWLGAELPG